MLWRSSSSKFLSKRDGGKLFKTEEESHPVTVICHRSKTIFFVSGHRSLRLFGPFLLGLSPGRKFDLTGESALDLKSLFLKVESKFCPLHKKGEGRKAAAGARASIFIFLPVCARP